MPTTVMIKEFLEHSFNKAVFVGLAHCFFECVGIILLKGSKELIDRVEEVDGVVNGARDLFAFGRETQRRRGSSSKYISKDTGDCGETVEREEGLNKARRRKCSG